MNNSDPSTQEVPMATDAPTLPPDIEPAGAESLTLSSRRPPTKIDPNGLATLQIDETSSPRRIKKREEKAAAAAAAAAATNASEETSREANLNATPTKTEEDKLKSLDRNKVFSVFLSMSLASDSSKVGASPLANASKAQAPQTPVTRSADGEENAPNAPSTSPFVPQVRSALRTCEITEPSDGNNENEVGTIKIDIENSEVPRDSNTCPCPKYDPHLWKQVCKNCFHPLASHRDGGQCSHTLEKADEYVPESIRQSISQRKQQTFADSQRGEMHKNDAGTILSKRNKSQRVQFIEQQREAHNIMESMLNIPGVKIKGVKPIAAGIGRSWKSFVASKGSQVKVQGPPPSSSAGTGPQRGACISSTPIKSAGVGAGRGKMQGGRKSRFAEGIVIPFEQEKVSPKQVATENEAKPAVVAVVSKEVDDGDKEYPVDKKKEVAEENVEKPVDVVVAVDAEKTDDKKEKVEDSDDVEVKIVVGNNDDAEKKEKKDMNDVEVEVKKEDKKNESEEEEKEITITVKNVEEEKKDDADVEVEVEVKKEDKKNECEEEEEEKEIKIVIENVEEEKKVGKKEEEEEEEDKIETDKKSQLEQAVERKSKELERSRAKKSVSPTIVPDPDTEVIKKDELRYLRQTETYLKDFIDDGNEEPPIQPLSDMFMTLISTAVSIAGIEDVPFVQDFLSGARIALSAKPEYAGMVPLTNSQLHGVKTVGKYSYILYRQQEFLKAVTNTQGMMTSKYMREYHNDNRRWMVEPFSSWSSSVKSLLREERKSCERFDAYEDSESVAAVIGLHKDLYARLEYICGKFPLSECWSIAAALAPFIDGASHAYSELCLSGKKDGAEDGDSAEDERRRNDLLDSTKIEFTALKARIESLIKVYPDVKEKVVSNVEKNLIQDDVDGLKALLPKIDDALAEVARAVALSATPAKEKDKKKRKKKDLDDSDSGEGKTGNRSDDNAEGKTGDDEEVAIKTPSKRVPSITPLSVSSSLRKSHSRRKKIKSTIDISGLKHLPELPPNPNRAVVIEGSITASVSSSGSDKDLCAESEPRSYICVLYNDYFVAYSEHSTSSACVRLKDATIVSNKTDGSFVLRSVGSDSAHGGNTRILTKKYRPHHHGDLDHLIHQSIAKLRVFGVPLEDLLEVEGGETSIPYVAMACMDYVEDHGFSKEGIFRLSGKPSVMAALREAFNGRSTDIDFTGVSPYDVAHLFKQFLAELPEPILTNDGYTRIMQLDADSALRDNSDDDSKHRLIASLHSIVYRLPQAYKDFSRSVFAFLSGCESESYKNKMTAGNLAVVLAPSILRPAANSAAASALPDMALIKKTNSMVKFLIENYFDIFI